METDTWIERLIIQQLSFRDERYRYNYGETEASTESLIADCAHLNDVGSEGPLKMFESLPQQYAEVEDDVIAAIDRLHDQGLIKNVGERPTQDAMTGEQFGTTTVWEPTTEGLAEAQRLNEAYSAALTELLNEHDNPSEISVDDVRPILREYGVVLDRLPEEFLEVSEADDQQ